MNAERITLDTNVLVYAIDRDAGERHERAAALVDGAVDLDCVLTLQALSEFFSAVTRKGKMPASDAKAQVEDWQVLFPIVAARPAILRHAIAAVGAHSLSFWDAMLWATARDSGVTVILSEDFQDGRELGGILFRNPFAAHTGPR